MKPAKPHAPKISELGKKLRKLSDKALASGTTQITQKQIRKIIRDSR